MSIKTTQKISRSEATSRIKQIHDLATCKDYKGIKSISYESESADIEKFVNNYDISIDHIEKWTNDMIENVMDMPFFRMSMFENYFIA